MKHLLKEFSDLSNLLQMLNDHRMVDVELFGIVSCSCKRIIFDNNSQLVVANFQQLATVLLIFKALVCFCKFATSWTTIVENSERDGNTRPLTCLLRNLCSGQEATVRTGHGTMDWFQIGKGVHQGSIWSPCLFNPYAEYIMRNAGLEEAQAGIKISRRNINNFRYADDTTLMAESEEELKSLLMKVK